jgi:hypothetical protein
MLLLTMLFLGVVDVQRPWDLRSYTGDTLALLTGRSRAYSYGSTERFLADVARFNGAEALTSALARWTTRLWQPEPSSEPDRPALFYIDGHRKPVYTDTLIPRGLVGRLSTVLGSRTLVLLHDASGHPLFITTHRGDQHLTAGLPTTIEQYEQEVGPGAVQHIVIDREGIGAEFLAGLKRAGRTATSVLRTDQ